MLVEKSQFHEVILKLCKPAWRSLDTETTGLLAFKDDSLFSIIISAEEETYYFNFQSYTDIDENKITAWLTEKNAQGVLKDFHYDNERHCLPREWLKDFAIPFDCSENKWFLQNAKFDMAMLAREGLYLAGPVHDTEAVARVLNNSYWTYKLKDLLVRMNADLGVKGIQKLDLTEKWVKEFGCTSKVEIVGKGKLEEVWHAERVPPHIMVPYGITDGEATRKLGMYQTIKLSNFPKRKKVFETELELTKALFDMEAHGFKINRVYTEGKLGEEMGKLANAKKAFEAITGQELIDSATHLAPILKNLGFDVPQTAKGNDSVAAEVIEAIDHPVASSLLAFRDAQKKGGTYYSSFLHYADKKDRVHGNFRQGGTQTGRLSCANPNLQNLPKPDEKAEESREIRSCFIPDDDFVLLSIDYDQMEYRLMLDEAGETELIDKVLGGLDVHESTAQMMGVTRQQAKTLNFMLLYGGGIAKLAKALNISLSEAKALKALYFEALPAVRNFIQLTMKKAQHAPTQYPEKGFTENWYGRVSYIDRKFAYKAPNYKIQGGCADVNKIAICRIYDFLKKEGCLSRMICTVHDENLFELHKSELHLASEFKKIMEAVYTPKRLPLTCGVSYSFSSWGELKEGLPSGEKT